MAKSSKGRKDALGRYEDLLRSFRKKVFQPLYFVYGTRDGLEDYLTGRLQQYLIQYALEEHERDFNLDIVYGLDSNADAVLAMCQMVPLMADRRVVIVRGFEQLKDNRLFTTYAKRPNPSAIVFLVCNGRPRLNGNPYAALKKHAQSAEFGPFRSYHSHKVSGFVSRLAKQAGCRFEEGAAQVLVDFVGVSLGKVANEFEKLRTYVGERDVITRNDIIQASGQTHEINIFELQDAVARRDHKESYRISDQLLLAASNSQGEGVRIVYILTAYFTKLWQLHGYIGKGERNSTYQLAQEINAHSKTKTSPFQINKQLKVLPAWPVTKLERAFSALLSADAELKGQSTRNPRLIMTLLINRLLFEPAVRNIH